METNDCNVFNKKTLSFGNSENDMNCINSEESVENDLFIEDLFSGFQSINCSTVYESMETTECEDDIENKAISRQSSGNRNESDFCDNNCQQIIKRLIGDNEELKKLKNELILLEEQNVELIKDKQRLESEIIQTKESLEKKIGLKNELIEDLKKSLYIFESLNSSLHKELEQKRIEKLNLETQVKEVEDKLYFSEIQLIESQKSEEELMTSYMNARQAFTEEEENKYKTIEQLHSVYVESAQQHNEIQELKQELFDLKREIADKDNELWFYKLKFDESFHKCANKSDLHSIESPKESIYINKTNSEIPEYSFSVNEDDLDHIYKDFNEDIPLKHSDESNEFHSLSESESNSDTIETKETKAKPFLLNLFYRLINCLAFLKFKIPFKLIFGIIFVVISAKLCLSYIFVTRLPAYTSWEEIIYRILLPYLTKVKVSKTQ